MLYFYIFILSMSFSPAVSLPTSTKNRIGPVSIIYSSSSSDTFAGGGYDWYNRNVERVYETMIRIMLGFWFFMLAVSMLVPILLIPIGRALEKAPIKDVNRFIGYRTNMSMKNADTWVFAQKFWGRKVFIFGLLSLPLAVVLMLFALNASIGFMAFYGIAVTAIIMAFVLAPSVLLTEKALKANFRQDGTRKENRI